MGSIVSVFIVVCWLVVITSGIRKKTAVHRKAAGSGPIMAQQVGSASPTAAVSENTRIGTPDTSRSSHSPEYRNTNVASVEGEDPCHTSVRYTDVSDASFYAGSMNVVSTEGVDPCHEEMFSLSPSAELAPEISPAIISLTPSDLAQAFVFSEILKRPAERTQRSLIR